jgi:hypothetical protein
VKKGEHAVLPPRTLARGVLHTFRSPKSNVVSGPYFGQPAFEFVCCMWPLLRHPLRSPTSALIFIEASWWVVGWATRGQRCALWPCERRAVSDCA